jgi:hypothetical protein
MDNNTIPVSQVICSIIEAFSGNICSPIFTINTADIHNIFRHTDYIDINMSIENLYGFDMFIRKYISDSCSLCKFSSHNTDSVENLSEFAKTLSSEANKLSTNIVIICARYYNKSQYRKDILIFTQKEMEVYFPYFIGKNWLNDKTELILDYKDEQNNSVEFRHKNVHCFNKIYALYNNMVARNNIENYINP